MIMMIMIMIIRIIRRVGLLIMIMMMMKLQRNGTREVETVADEGAPAKEVGKAKPPSLYHHCVMPEVVRGS